MYTGWKYMSLTGGSGIPGVIPLGVTWLVNGAITVYPCPGKVFPLHCFYVLFLDPEELFHLPSVHPYFSSH